MNKSELDYVTGNPTKDAILKRVEEPISKGNSVSDHRLSAYLEGMVTSNSAKNIPDHE